MIRDRWRFQLTVIATLLLSGGSTKWDTREYIALRFNCGWVMMRETIRRTLKNGKEWNLTKSIIRDWERKHFRKSEKGVRCASVRMRGASRRKNAMHCKFPNSLTEVARSRRTRPLSLPRFSWYLRTKLRNESQHEVTKPLRTPEDEER